MLYRTTDKPEATEIVIIDSQIDYRGKLDTYCDKIVGFYHMGKCNIMELILYHKEKFVKKTCAKKRE